MLLADEPRTLWNLLRSAHVRPGEQQVNPKGYFANERTFLHWQSLCLVLGGLGIGLVNLSSDVSGQLAGVIFSLVGLGFSGYALINYLNRADLLAGKQKGLSFEDIPGAIAMVCVVFVAIGINFLLHFLLE